MKAPRFSAKDEVVGALESRLEEARGDALRASVISLVLEAVKRMSESELRKLAGLGK